MNAQLSQAPRAEPVAMLANFAQLRAGTLDEVRQTVSKSYCDHLLERHSPSKPGTAVYNRASFGTMSFNYLKYGADVTVFPDCFESFYMLEIPVTGRSIIQYDGTTVRSEGPVGAIVSSQGVVQSRWQESTGRLMIKIDREFLERFLANLLGRALTRPLEFEVNIDMMSGVGVGLRAYAMHIAEQLAKNSYLTQYPLVEQEVERTILTMLLCGQPHNYSREINAVSRPGAPKYVSLAYDFINEHFRDDISVADLVEVSGVSMRTLYAGFKCYIGVSPMLALKTRRLQAVHEDLLNPESNSSVTEIACRWGFTHLGNFSRDYRRRYGELPSETMRRRASPARAN